MPEPATTTAAAIGGPRTALLALGLAGIGMAYADERNDDVHPDPVATVEVPSSALPGGQVGVVLDPSAITGPGGLIAVAWVLGRVLKGWEPRLGISVSMDDRTHGVTQEFLQLARRGLDRLFDRGDQQ